MRGSYTGTITQSLGNQNYIFKDDISGKRFRVVSTMVINKGSRVIVTGNSVVSLTGKLENSTTIRV